jgi:hypothetical protein
VLWLLKFDVHFSTPNVHSRSIGRSTETRWRPSPVRLWPTVTVRRAGWGPSGFCADLTLATHLRSPGGAVNLLFAPPLDQRCVAGFGNRWANEVCFPPRTQPLHTGQTGTAVLRRRKSRPTAVGNAPYQGEDVSYVPIVTRTKDIFRAPTIRSHPDHCRRSHGAGVRSPVPSRRFSLDGSRRGVGDSVRPVRRHR